MLAFIGYCKDFDHVNNEYWTKNDNRRMSQKAKYRITKGILLALEEFLVEVDKAWTDNTQPGSLEYWTKETAVNEVWNKRKEKIKQAKFLPQMNPDDEYNDTELKAIHGKITKMTKATFAGAFQ